MSAAATGWHDDSDVLRVTVDEALAADQWLESYGFFDRVVEVIEAQPPSLRHGVFYAELLAHRAELLDGVAGGSRSAGVALGVYSASGGSMRDLFESVAGDGGKTIARTTHELAEEGLVEEAEQLDRALAVARLLVSGGDSVLGSPPAPNDEVAGGSVAQLDGLVEAGVDVAVAANSVRVGGMPDRGELRGLVEQLSSVFAPAGGFLWLSDEQRAWLPFSIRVALSDGGFVAPRSVTAGEGRIQSSPVDGRFRSFGDSSQVRVDVIAELGRAGIDVRGDGETLAALLADIVMPSADGFGDIRSHRSVADAVADPTVGLDAAFFRVLGVDWAQTLADAVVVESSRSQSEAGVGGGALAAGFAAPAVLARYGDAMAAAERRGELGFGARELLGDDRSASSWATGGYLGASNTFSREFALDASVALIDAGRNPETYGEFDPRAMAVDQVTRHGGDASVALFGLLGDDFLDDLLWNSEPIESPDVVHPVYRLFAPVLDEPALRPGLATEIIIAAGRDHDGHDAPLYTGDVIQHAFISDKFLLAPEHSYRLGGANSTGYTDSFPGDEDVVNAVETVYTSGSGDGLIMMANGVIPHVVTEAINVAGPAEISEDTAAVYMEIVGKLSAGEFNVALHQAMEADAQIERAKFVGSAVTTALPGALPLTAAASVGTGLAVNLASGPMSEIVEADYTLGVFQDDWVDVRRLGGDFRDQAAFTLVELGVVDLKMCPPHNYFDVAYLPVSSADGTPSGDLEYWLRAASHIHSLSGEHEAAVVEGGW